MSKRAAVLPAALPSNLSDIDKNKVLHTFERANVVYALVGSGEVAFIPVRVEDYQCDTSFDLSRVMLSEINGPRKWEAHAGKIFLVLTFLKFR